MEEGLEIKMQYAGGMLRPPVQTLMATLEEELTQAELSKMLGITRSSVAGLTEKDIQLIHAMVAHLKEKNE